MSRIIPTYENGDWTTTEFSSDLEFREYLESIFKELSQSIATSTPEQPVISGVGSTSSKVVSGCDGFPFVI